MPRSRSAAVPLTARLGLGLGLFGLGWVVVSLWPDAGHPAWPAASAGFLGLALTRLPGPAGHRALGAFASTVALTLGVAQILLLALVAKIAGAPP